uniref:Uncharacterized protein n=1 Tax=Oryza glaberrima TaxID=4538 RepID=I1PUG1_ORYGL
MPPTLALSGRKPFFFTGIRCWKHGHLIWLGSTGLQYCTYMIQEPALNRSRPPIVHSSPRSLAGCRATPPIPKPSPCYSPSISA